MNIPLMCMVFYWNGLDWDCLFFGEMGNMRGDWKGVREVRPG